MLDEGTETRSWRRVAAEAEDRGISITAFGGYEVIGLALDGPAAESERMIDWAAELAAAPAFDAERWAWQRQLAAAELESMLDEPQAVAGWSFLRQLYGAHPRGRPLQGDGTSLAELRVEHSEQSYRRAVADGAIVTLAGAVDEVAVEARLREVLAGYFPSPDAERADGLRTSASPASSDLEVELPVGGERRQTVELPGDQAHVFLGRRTVTRDHPDLPALELLSVVLGAGAGLSGRLPERIRERDGLAYTTGVDTAAGAAADPGRFVVYAATSAERVPSVERAVSEELDRLLHNGVAESELTAARTFLEGQDLFRRETARQWADLMAEAEHTGMPVDSPSWAAERWSALDATELRRVAERWLDPAELYVTVGLPR